jgi:hypothetical protein
VGIQKSLMILAKDFVYVGLVKPTSYLSGAATFCRMTFSRMTISITLQRNLSDTQQNDTQQNLCHFAGCCSVEHHSAECHSDEE